MTVRTTYFGGLNSSFEPADGDAIFGVVRYPQDFVERITDRNILAVAPPEELLNAYKAVEEAADENGEANPAAIAWNSVDFERRYREYLEQPGPQTVISELADRARERDIWLVCWEKDARWCHRRLLANEVVSQLEDIEVVHHPNPSTIPIDTGNDESDDDPDATLADFAEAGGA
ncbi:DUF488 family protein, N3 subclade [Natrinema versiforme]|uniref:DUF488 domain-containing protein n=1 Tax=Natrinema versiforme JCM 10478 TaxID=1227496 RepID=L9XTJ5_9EURY|nr:DUF488 family protein [Natrinema versiforme]ELY63948.1 hypothetical protein C489_17912 [Natrinema versiforme JCM 10478]